MSVKLLGLGLLHNFLLLSFLPRRCLLPSFRKVSLLIIDYVGDKKSRFENKHLAFLVLLCCGNATWSCLTKDYSLDLGGLKQ